MSVVSAIVTIICIYGIGSSTAESEVVIGVEYGEVEIGVPEIPAVGPEMGMPAVGPEMGMPAAGPGMGRGAEYGEPEMGLGYDCAGAIGCHDHTSSRIQEYGPDIEKAGFCPRQPEMGICDVSFCKKVSIPKYAACP